MLKTGLICIEINLFLLSVGLKILVVFLKTDWSQTLNTVKYNYIGQYKGCGTQVHCIEISRVRIKGAVIVLV